MSSPSQRRLANAALLLGLAHGLVPEPMQPQPPMRRDREDDETDAELRTAADAERIAEAEAKRARKNAKRAAQFRPA